MIEFVIRLGELTLKGENKSLFEKRLRRNIRRMLHGVECELRHRSDRFYLRVPEEDAPLAERVLSGTFGIVGFAKSYRVDKSISAVIEAAEAVAADAGADRVRCRFKVRSKRSDKSFPMSSHEIESAVGDALRARFPLLEVNLSDPDLLVRVEIREAAYVFGNDTPGPGGLPVSCAGRGTLLLSGGIDSPVAGYLMAKRGLKLDAVYFDSYPYTSEDARDKVADLATMLSRYNVGLTLFNVPFTDICLRIREKAREKYITLLMRASMMEVATRITTSRHSLALVTGDSLSQVASQTVESIRFADAHAGYPVYRPLVGFDKLETVELARRIGTYDTSVRPYPDCCTVFRPAAPSIRPRLTTVEREYHDLEIESLIETAAESAGMRWFEPAEGSRL